MLTFRHCNSQRRHDLSRHGQQLRRALTLTELLMTIAIMGMMALALGSLAQAVQQNSEFSYGTGAALQHARVALNRIEQHAMTATASEDFPGFAVFEDTDGSWDFPDTLVVWHPDSAPANPGGRPLFSELVIYCPDPAAPNELVEITVPGDNRVAPELSQTATWQSELNTIKAGVTSQKVTLLDMLHTASADGGATPRGAVRFVQRLLPSESDWAAYQASNMAWEDLPWCQGIYGANTGVRQSWCRIELQLEAREPGTSLGSGAVIPFFGSAALYYQLNK